MDFDDSKFAWGDYSLSASFEGLDQKGKQSISALARAEKEFEDILAGKLPTISAEKIKERRLAAARYLEQTSSLDSGAVAKREVNRLVAMPDRIFEYLNTLALMAPTKVPFGLRQELLARKAEINALVVSIRQSIEEMGKQESVDPKDVAQQEQSIQAQINHLERLCSGFTKGIDIKVLRLAKEVQRSTLIAEKTFKSQSEFLGKWDANTQALYHTGEYLHAFLTGKADLRVLSRQIIGLFKRVSDYRLKSIVQDARAGRLGKNPLLRSVLKRNLLNITPGFKLSKFAQTVSRISAQFTKLLAALLTPIAATASILVAVAAFWMLKKRKEIEFNSNLLDSVGLVNQLASSKLKTTDPQAESDRFFQTIYQYFYDNSQTYTKVLPDGSKVNVQSNKIMLGLNEKKYADLLDSFVKYGVTLSDLESEFQTVEINPMLDGAANISKRAINLKEPLELQYALAQVYGVEPEELGRNVGEWSFSYGSLITESQESLAAIYQLSTESMVNPNQFRAAVIEMSDAYGYFVSRAEFVGRKLSDLIRRGVYGLNHGKDLLNGVLQELTGYSTRELMGILGQTVSENSDGLFQFLQESRKTVMEQIEVLKVRNSRITDGQQRRNNQATIELLSSMASNLDFYLKNRNAESLDLSRLASTVQNLFSIFPDLAFQMSDTALSARFATIFGNRLPQRELNFEELIKLQQASQTMGFNSDRVANYVAGMRYEDSSKRSAMPEQHRLGPDELRSLTLQTAVNVTSQTFSSAEMMDQILDSWANKFYLFLEALKGLTVQLFSGSSNEPEPSGQVVSMPTTGAPTTASTPFAGASRVVDYTHIVPASGKRDHAPKVRAIVVHSTEGDLKGSLALWQNGSNTSAHYIIGKDGTVYRTVPESQVAHHAGKVGHRSPLVKRGEFRAGEDFNEYSLGIEMEHVRAGDKYSDEAYRSLARLVARQMAEYHVDIDHVISHAEVAAGRSEGGVPSTQKGEFRSDPVNFDWKKFYQYLAAERAQYQVETPSTPSRSANTQAVTQITRQISSDSTLDRYLTRAWETQEVLSKNQTYEQFSSAARGFFSQYKPETLRDMLRGSGKGRVQLYKDFAHLFHVKLQPSVLMRMLDTYVRENEYIQTSYETTIRQKIRQAYFKKFKTDFTQFYQSGQGADLHLSSVAPLRVGLDQQFQAQYADELLNQKTNMLLEEHVLDVYAEGGVGRQFLTELKKQFSAGEIISDSQGQPQEIQASI